MKRLDWMFILRKIKQSKALQHEIPVISSSDYWYHSDSVAELCKAWMIASFFQVADVDTVIPATDFLLSLLAISYAFFLSLQFLPILTNWTVNFVHNKQSRGKLRRKVENQF